MSRVTQMLTDLAAAAAKHPKLWLAVLVGALALALTAGLLLRRQRRDAQQAASTWSVQAVGLPPDAGGFALPPGTPSAPTDVGRSVEDEPSPDAVPMTAAVSEAAPSATQSLAWWDDDQDDTSDAASAPRASTPWR
jgi:hypothetical protein